MIELQLPWPPSLNTYWRNVVMGKSARTLISKRGREYREETMAAVIDQHAGELLRGRLSVEVVLNAPDRRGRDLDNHVKATLDAITHSRVVWEDDGQIDELRIVRGAVKSGGGCRVSITEIRPGVEQMDLAGGF